jgi:hypothetical protein
MRWSHGIAHKRGNDAIDVVNTRTDIVSLSFRWATTPINLE